MGSIRRRFTAALLALASTGLALTVPLAATPAEAAWSNTGGLTRFQVCRAPAPTGHGWVVLAKVRKRAGSPDARAGMTVLHGRDERQRWSSGWLPRHRAERGWVRTRRGADVRLRVWQEAGDRDSPVGTALEVATYDLRSLRRCAA